MYHLKNDIRAERSAELLCQGLMDVLKEKPLAKVTVSDLSRASTVGRATFYRNFDEVADLLAWRCDRMFQELISGFADGNPDLSQEDSFLHYLLRYWMEEPHRKLLEILIDSGRTDIIYNSFVRTSDRVLAMLREQKISMSTDDFEYFISVRAGFFVGIIRAWIRNGKTQTADEVAAIIRRQHDDVTLAGLLI